jgi:hypothetical protein
LSTPMNSIAAAEAAMSHIHFSADRQLFHK